MPAPRSSVHPSVLTYTAIGEEKEHLFSPPVRPLPDRPNRGDVIMLRFQDIFSQRGNLKLSHLITLIIPAQPVNSLGHPLAITT